MDKEKIENEFIALLIEARKKGMTTQQFFSLADMTLEHLKGKVSNDTLAKIMDDDASPEEVLTMLNNLDK